MNSGVNGMYCPVTAKKSRPIRAAIALGRATRLANTAVLVVVLLASLPVPAQTAKISDLNLNRLAEAVNAISQGDLPKAESLLKSVLARLPKDADALNLLGVVRGQQQKLAEAERLFRLALAASPAHIGAHV